MFSLQELILYLVTIVTLTSGCSEPIGGFKEPTPANKVHYAKHVVVGEVTSLIRPDPMFNGMYEDSTYGAWVTVQCSFKGGPLTGRIKIGGAGFIPGMCTAKDLVANTKYVLFLEEKQPGSDHYMQSETAVQQSNIGSFLGVCGLQMDYPEESGMMLRRQVCPSERVRPEGSSVPGTCVRYNEKTRTDVKEVIMKKETDINPQLKMASTPTADTTVRVTEKAGQILETTTVPGGTSGVIASFVVTLICSLLPSILTFYVQ